MAVAVVAYLLWGLLTIYWKQLERFDAAELILWRMACAAVVMALVVSVRRSWTDLRRSVARPATLVLLMVSALLLTVNWGSYVWAVVNDRVIETALGYFMAPLATMAIGVLVLGEVPTAAQRLAFGLAAVAVVVLTISYGRPPWVALVLAATWSLYGLAKRRVGLPAVESLAGETLVLVVPALATIAVLGARDGGVVATASAREWVFVLGTGVITAVPLLLFASAAASIPFTLLGPLNLIVPVINFGLGWLLYDEPMPLDRIIGFAFVWAALAAVIWDRVQAARTPAVVAVPVTS
ncbi:MAG: EamA family transporter RarD [Actinomycetota bacterium]